MSGLLALELAASNQAREDLISDDGLRGPTRNTAKDIHAERDMIYSKLEAADKKMASMYRRGPRGSGHMRFCWPFVGVRLAVSSDPETARSIEKDISVVL
jgi:hypothetical protein